MGELASTLTCHGNEPITVVALGVGRLDPPITLQPGQFLIILSETEVAAFEHDCQVGESSRLIEEGVS